MKYEGRNYLLQDEAARRAWERMPRYILERRKNGQSVLMDLRGHVRAILPAVGGFNHGQEADRITSEHPALFPPR